MYTFLNQKHILKMSFIALLSLSVINCGSDSSSSSSDDDSSSASDVSEVVTSSNVSSVNATISSTSSLISSLSEDVGLSADANVSASRLSFIQIVNEACDVGGTRTIDDETTPGTLTVSYDECEDGYTSDSFSFSFEADGDLTGTVSPTTGTPTSIAFTAEDFSVSYSITQSGNTTSFTMTQDGDMSAEITGSNIYSITYGDGTDAYMFSVTTSGSSSTSTSISILGDMSFNTSTSTILSGSEITMTIGSDTISCTFDSDFTTTTATAAQWAAVCSVT